ncbi:hypothetical protein GCM10020254_67330 [Streptomyces goshikiensis]
MEAELANLRLALECCLEDPEEVHLGQYLAGTLWFYWAGCGRLTEGRHWLDRALENLPQAGYEGSRLKALWVLGYVAALQGDTVASMSALYECRDGAARTENPVATAYAVHRLGCLALVSDDMARAGELLGSALERYREAGELNSNVLMCQVELAMALAFQGDLAGALAVPGGPGHLRGAGGALDEGVRPVRTGVRGPGRGRHRGGAAAAGRVRGDQPRLPGPGGAGAGGGAARAGHGHRGRTGRGGGAPGRGGTDVGRGGPAAVRLGVLQRAETDVPGAGG